MEPEVLEEEINQFFNENYDGRYRTSIDIDDARDQAYIYVAFEEGSEKPGVGAFVDEIFEELDIDNPRMEADWYPEENRYDITLTENVDEPLPGQKPQTSV
ncbi:hypothetical protein [Candidatus Nanohalovita haloferacivicina]|uniref:hypothetical protein n=1 Tax=Candidatus Nanohalovita haloferacivicina TaxID=2978046 RepID=UPI00325FD3EF|nr:hypothetical protein HBNXNv_0055 [Candidatus Nanohalobia archaeon BNXNv]